ncbi:unnamed protein product, partial [Agarophyton chilense]
LSSSVKTAVAQFALRVGQPRVIEPAGFRDFRGWLAFVGSRAAAAAWAPLVDAVLRDTRGDAAAIDALKTDLVREIVKRVVVPRPTESSKLVSTNCGRQCARPLNGVTLMTILDGVFHDVAEWRSFIDAMPSASSSSSSPPPPPPHLLPHGLHPSSLPPRSHAAPSPHLPSSSSSSSSSARHSRAHASSS